MNLTLLAVTLSIITSPTDCLNATCRVRILDRVATGVLIDNSHIITCAHVVSPYTQHQVNCEWFIKGNSVRNYGHCVRLDKQSDLALIRLANANTNIKPIPLADYEVTKGNVLYTVGCPSGIVPSLHVCHVAGFYGNDIGFLPKPNEGHSGGALFDISGKYVVGIVKAYTDENIGVATNLRYLKQLTHSPSVSNRAGNISQSKLPARGFNSADLVESTRKSSFIPNQKVTVVNFDGSIIETFVSCNHGENPKQCQFCNNGQVCNPYSSYSGFGYLSPCEPPVTQSQPQSQLQPQPEYINQDPSEPYKPEIYKPEMLDEIKQQVAIIQQDVEYLKNKPEPTFNKYDDTQLRKEIDAKFSAITDAFTNQLNNLPPLTMRLLAPDGSVIKEEKAKLGGAFNLQLKPKTN